VCYPYTIYREEKNERRACPGPRKRAQCTLTYGKEPGVSMCGYGLTGHPTVLVLVRGPVTPRTHGRVVLAGRVRPRTTLGTGLGVVFCHHENAARGAPYQVALASPFGVRVQCVTGTNGRCRRGVVLALAASSAVCTGWLVAWAATVAHSGPILDAPRSVAAHRTGTRGGACSAEMPSATNAGLYVPGLCGYGCSVLSTRRAVTSPRRRVCPDTTHLACDIPCSISKRPGSAWFTVVHLGR